MNLKHLAEIRQFTSSYTNKYLQKPLSSLDKQNVLLLCIIIFINYFFISAIARMQQNKNILEKCNIFLFF